MKKTFFLAETPRGGPYGHRFIIPPDPELRAAEIECFFQKASQGDNDDYISAKHQVVQCLPNGAVREGTETILMAGLKVHTLTPSQLAEIDKILAARLTDLEALITQKINWEETGNNTIIIRKELADWGKFDPTPSFPGPAFKTVKDKSIDYSATILGVILGLAFGLISLFFWFY